MDDSVKQQLRARLLKIKLAGINLPNSVGQPERREEINNTKVPSAILDGTKKQTQNRIKQEVNHINTGKPITPVGGDAVESQASRMRNALKRKLAKIESITRKADHPVNDVLSKLPKRKIFGVSPIEDRLEGRNETGDKRVQPSIVDDPTRHNQSGTFKKSFSRENAKKYAQEHGHAIVFKGIPIGPYKVASLVESNGHFAKYWLLNAKQTNGNGWGISAHTAKENMSKFIGRPLVVTSSSWHGASEYGNSFEHPYLPTNNMNQIFAHQEKFRVGNITSVEGDKNGDYFAIIEMLPKFANMVLPPFCSPAIYQLDANEHEGNISKWEALHLAALDENPAYGARIALLKGTCVGTANSCSIQFKSAKLETKMACPIKVKGRLAVLKQRQALDMTENVKLNMKNFMGRPQKSKTRFETELFGDMMATNSKDKMHLLSNLESTRDDKILRRDDEGTIIDSLGDTRGTALVHSFNKDNPHGIVSPIEKQDTKYQQTKMLMRKTSDVGPQMNRDDAERTIDDIFKGNARRSTKPIKTTQSSKFSKLKARLAAVGLPDSFGKDPIRKTPKLDKLVDKITGIAMEQRRKDIISSSRKGDPRKMREDPTTPLIRQVPFGPDTTRIENLEHGNPKNFDFPNQGMSDFDKFQAEQDALPTDKQFPLHEKGFRVIPHGGISIPAEQERKSIPFGKRNYDSGRLKARSNRFHQKDEDALGIAKDLLLDEGKSKFVNRQTKKIRPNKPVRSDFTSIITAKLKLKLASLGMNNMTYQSSKPVKIHKKKHPEERK